MSDLVELFEKYVDRRGDDECWPWKGNVIKKDKRGVLWVKELKKNVVAPRVSWFVAHGSWPGKKFVCHSCDNPNCVNPKHLWLGDARSNARDAAAKGRLAMQRDPMSSFFADPASNQHRPRGEKHGSSVLTEEQVRWIRENYRPKTRLFGGRAMARKLGVHFDTVRNVINNRSWRHL